MGEIEEVEADHVDAVAGQLLRHQLRLVRIEVDRQQTILTVRRQGGG